MATISHLAVAYNGYYVDNKNEVTARLFEGDNISLVDVEIEDLFLELTSKKWQESRVFLKAPSTLTKVQTSSRCVWSLTLWITSLSPSSASTKKTQRNCARQCRSSLSSL